MRIELRGFVQTGGDAVVISANGDGVQSPDSVDCFDGIWAISHDVSAAKHRVITRLFSTLDAGFQALRGWNGCH